MPRLIRTATWLLVLALFPAGTIGDVPRPALTITKDGQCVAPTDVIRRDHMKFLLHQRDDTVHRGIRTPQHSLVGCVNCHANPDGSGRMQPVNAPGQFCASCHEYAAVKIDCFECHASTPDDNGGKK